MGTRHQGTDAENRALDAYIKLMRAADSVTDRVHRHLAANALTVSQFGVLEALYHLGPLTLGVLAKKLLKSGGNMTLVAANLERRGLVRRTRVVGNRRYVTLTISPSGRRLVAAVFPRHVREIVAAFGPLPPRDQERLAALCRRLGLGR
jgi:MarR family transcriptional regulator, 2-MHQ and catechol-resistance regulon repressor